MKREKIISNINDITLKYGCILEFIVSLFLAISMFKFITYKTYYEHISYKNIAIIVISILVILYIMVLNLIKNCKKLEKLFLTFIIPIGLIFLILMIPGFVADEPAHMYRAYDVSNGVIFAEPEEDGSYMVTIPKSLDLNNRDEFNSYKILMDRLNEKADYQNTEEVWCPAQGYNAVMYIFSSIAFLIGRIFSLNIFITIYLARILNFTFFIILGYYMIKLVPVGKLAFFVYLFNPMLIHQATSVSADSIINTVTLFFIAYTLYLTLGREPISKIKKVIYITLAISVALLKYVYFPLVILSIFLISKKSMKKDKIGVVILIIISIVLALISFYLGNRYSGPANSEQATNINSVEQVKYILTHPIQYVGVVLNTVFQFGEYYFYGFNGKYLGWINIFVNSVPILLYALILISTVIFEKQKITCTRKQKIWLLLVFLIISALIFTGMYMSCSEVGADGIAGVQGRYFIPIIILVLLTLISKDKYVEYKYSNIVYTLILLFINISVALTIRKFFSI